MCWALFRFVACRCQAIEERREPNLTECDTFVSPSQIRCGNTADSPAAAAETTTPVFTQAKWKKICSFGGVSLSERWRLVASPSLPINCGAIVRRRRQGNAVSVNGMYRRRRRRGRFELGRGGGTRAKSSGRGVIASVLPFAMPPPPLASLHSPVDPGRSDVVTKHLFLPPLPPLSLPPPKYSIEVPPNYCTYSSPKCTSNISRRNSFLCESK